MAQAFLHFVAAVAIELSVDVFFVASALTRNPVNIPGSLVRLAGMGALGLMAVFWGKSWARWLFAASLYVTGTGFLVASFFPLGGAQFKFSPEGIVFALGYLALAVAASVGKAKPNQ